MKSFPASDKIIKPGDFNARGGSKCNSGEGEMGINYSTIVVLQTHKLSITIQYNTIQYNTIQYNTIQYNTIQYNTIQYNTIQYNTIQYNTIQYNTIQYNETLLIPVKAITFRSDEHCVYHI